MAAPVFPFRGIPIQPTALALADVRQVTDALAAHFGVTPPKLEALSPRSKRGYYRPATGTIRVGAGTWCGWHAVVHEFAHHLHNLAQIEARKSAAANVAAGLFGWRRQRSHGVEFCRHLLQVVTFAFADPKEYMWAREYRSIRAWAAKRGLCAPRPRPVSGGGWLVLKPVVPVLDQPRPFLQPALAATLAQATDPWRTCDRAARAAGFAQPKGRGYRAALVAFCVGRGLEYPRGK